MSPLNKFFFHLSSPENKGEKSPSIFSRNMNERPTGGFEGLEEEERQRTKQVGMKTKQNKTKQKEKKKRLK